MALVFPPSPAVGERYPVDPGTPDVTQYEYDGEKWNVVPVFVRLNDQLAYNSYLWPTADGTANQQLTTDGAGNLTWENSAAPSLKVLSLLETFDGAATSFTLVESGTTTPVEPTPSGNIVVFLGGVPQTPVAAYTVSTNTITFTEAPLTGTVFYAITSVVL